MANVVLYVGGITDEIIVSNILAAAGFDTSAVRIEVAGGKTNAIRFAKMNIRHSPQLHTAVLFESDTVHIPDALEQARQYFKVEEGVIHPFVVIPSIEAWLFADDRLISRHAPEKHRKNIERLPLPESIPFPKMVFSSWVGNKDSHNLAETYAFLREMDIVRASARCPSLHYFLKELAALLGVEIQLPDYSEMPYSELIAGLLKETLNEDTVVYRTLKGSSVTARELRQSVMENSPEGSEYARTLLKVARDILRSQAQKHAELTR